MVSVDDLIISLRIEDTSNLGKLQKQLSALVGEKGGKKMDLGDLDPGIKRDITLIKDRIVKFTPSVIVGENIKEAALNLAADLRKDENLKSVMLQRYNINIDKYESFIEELFNISMGISKMNNDQSKGFIAEMTKFRMIADMIGGDRETMIKRLTRMKLEAGFHENLVEAFREAGIKMLSKPLMFELTKKSIGKRFDDVIKEAEIGEEKEKFADLKEIFDKNSDSLKGISEAYKYMKGEIFDITEITQDMIENDKDLRLIIVAQIASAINKSNWMFEQFYKAGKSFFTKGKAFGVAGAAELDTIVHRFSNEALKQLGLEHVIGSKIDEATVNFLGEVKTVAGKSEVDYEVTKRIVKQGYNELYFFLEEFTDGMKNYIEEFLSKKEHKGIKIGAYKMTSRLTQKLLGIESKLEDTEKTARALLEKQAEEMIDITKEEIPEEFTEEMKKTGISDKLESMEKTARALLEKQAEEMIDVSKEEIPDKLVEWLEDTEEFSKQKPLTKEDLAGKESTDRISDLVDGFEEMKDIVEDTNKKVNEEKDEPKREESDI